MKIKVTTPEGENFEYVLSTACRWEIRDGHLFNLNTQHFEGVDGDIVNIPHSSMIKIDGEPHTMTSYEEEIVKGYTCYQFVETNKQHYVFSANDARELVYNHISYVEEI